jgi:predicted DNA-binding transcriptional regulator AlpA
MDANLVGFTEVAQLLSASEAAVARYIKRADFPEPAGRLARGKVWLRSEVVAWGRDYLPLRRGRPPGSKS